MRDSAPADVMGYAVVHLPAQGAWQGWFVRSSFREKGEALLAQARSVSASGPGQVGVACGAPDTAAADQTAIGSISALMARLLMIRISEPSRLPTEVLEDAMGGAVHALHLATGWPWLLVTGTPSSVGSAMLTDVQRIDASSLDHARELLLAQLSHDGEMQRLGETFKRGLDDIDGGGA